MSLPTAKFPDAVVAETYLLSHYTTEYHERIAAEIIAMQKETQRIAADVIAMQDEIQRMFLRTPVGANLLPDPSFEAGATGWTLESAIRTNQLAPLDGTWCIQTNAGVEGARFFRTLGARIPVTPGSTVVMACDLKVNDLSQLILLILGQYDASVVWKENVTLIANDVSASSLGLTDVNVWKRLYGQATLRSDAAFLVPVLYGNRAPSAGAGVWAAFDNIFLGEVTLGAFV